jgi:hypothetical protein
MGFLPEPFIQGVNAAGVDYVIVALRYSGVGVRPNAAAYLTAFQENNWTIVGHAVLGPGDLLSNGGFSTAIPNANAMPSNAIAAQLRQGWGII